MTFINSQASKHCYPDKYKVESTPA